MQGDGTEVPGTEHRFIECLLCAKDCGREQVTVLALEGLTMCQRRRGSTQIVTQVTCKARRGVPRATQPQKGPSGKGVGSTLFRGLGQRWGAVDQASGRDSRVEQKGVIGDAEIATHLQI